MLIPQRHERDDAHRIIYDELCRGLIEESSRSRYREVVGSLQARGAEGAVLGCTKIGMLLETHEVNVPLFDMARLHTAAAVAEAVGS